MPITKNWSQSCKVSIFTQLISQHLYFGHPKRGNPNKLDAQLLLLGDFWIINFYRLIKKSILHIVKNTEVYCGEKILENFWMGIFRHLFTIQV